jgi:hypothetical protein
MLTYRNSQLWSADILQGWYSTRDQDVTQLARFTFHTPQPRVFNNNITMMEDLGIILKTPGGYNAG